MKRMVIREWADPPEYRLEESAVPSPGAGELQVAVHTAGVNFGDSLINSGRYQVRPRLPFVPGSECSGVVTALGCGVTGFAVGDHIAAHAFIKDAGGQQRNIGTWAEQLVVPVANALRVPTSIPLEAAALFRSNTETSYLAMQRAQLKAGETLLVLGASGGTGFAAVQLGKLLGARVIASASSAEKRAIAMAAGADIAIDSRDPDWRARVREVTNGRGPDVVYDPVGGDATEAAFRALAPEGRLLVVGFAAGRIPTIPANLALLKNISLVGVNLLQELHLQPARARADAEKLMSWFEQGKLGVPPIAARFPLSRAAEAVELVAAGKVAGRVIIEVTARN
jgi:NADPH:quinone reductase